MKVRDLMTEDVVSAGRGDTLAAAWEVMLDRGFRHLPVTDGEGDLIGVLSHRDIATCLGNTARGDMVSQTHQLEEIIVRDVMSEVVETVDPDDMLSTAAEILLDRKISCLPVVEGSRLVGILTESDFVRLVLSQLEL